MTEKRGIWNGAAILMMCLAGIPCASAAAAPDGVFETNSGVYLGLKFTGSSLRADDDAVEEFVIKDDGGGLQIDLGYRFNRAFALELSLGGSRHETSDPAVDATIGSLWINGFYRFCPDMQFRPFVKFGLGGHSLEVKDADMGARIEGAGVAIGAGFRFFFNPHFSLGLDLTHNIIQYETSVVSLGALSYTFEIDEEGALTTLGVSFGYSF